MATVALKRFGGLDAFCREWKHQFEETTPGSPTAARMLHAILNLTMAVEAAQRPPPLPNPSKPVRADPLGLGEECWGELPITEEDINREIEKVMAKYRGVVAPNIQEALLLLPLIERGRDTLLERHLCRIMAESDWREQLQLWKSYRMQADVQLVQ